jgi:hypothetical protein
MPVPPSSSIAPVFSPAFEVKAALILGLKDVVGGTANGGSTAVLGRDLATGRDLVDAVASWQLVP